MLATVINIDKNGKRYAFPEKNSMFPCLEIKSNQITFLFFLDH